MKKKMCPTNDVIKYKKCQEMQRKLTLIMKTFLSSYPNLSVNKLFRNVKNCRRKMLVVYSEVKNI